MERSERNSDSFEESSASSSCSSIEINLSVATKTPACTNLLTYLERPQATILWRSNFWSEDNPKSIRSNCSFGPLTSNEVSDVFSTESWLVGGSLGSRNSFLFFRSSALVNATEYALQNMPGYKLHVAYKVLQAETKLLAKLLECHGVSEVTNMGSMNFNILWTGSHPKPGTFRSLAPHQRINHFPRSYELTRKDRLYKNIERMQHAKGIKHFDFVPQTFVMPAEYKELCSTHNRVKGPWIVKPVASSRGRGIFIVENPSQVPLEEPVVVAKYISKPLLVHGHKCDLRLYIAVTSFDPLLVYIYEEGLVRFATVKYDTSHKELWNPCMHLCNYSINKYHSDYIKSDDPSVENVGHKWTLSALLRHLKSEGKDTTLLMSQIEDLVVKAILSSANTIVSACRMFVPNCNNCFELYGFDILIDSDLKPWLLEINLSPSLGCDTALDVRLKSAMLADLLTLVGIPAVDPMLRPSTMSNEPSKSNSSVKTKLGSCRRVQSADGLSNTLPMKKSCSSSSRFAPNILQLNAEELKLVRMAKSQFERRGGYVRIFPTADSWNKYAAYLDPVSGIPIAGCVSSTYNLVVPHNFNHILHMQLFPDVPLTYPNRPPERASVSSRVSSLDRKKEPSLIRVNSNARQDRYERKLNQDPKVMALLPLKSHLGGSNSAELKKQVCDMIRNGKRLSQGEARKAFSQYLGFVLKRLSSMPDNEGQVEIVIKFLQKASKYLRTPFLVKPPSHKLHGKDRAAIVAKQLNDFLYLYNRETDLYGDILDRPESTPNKMFAEFLQNARF